MMSWCILFLAGCFEVGFTTCLKYSENFTRLWPSIGFLITSVLSFVFLNKAVQTIPLGTAYAVWTGIGAVGTALVGIYLFKDPVTFARCFFLCMIILSIVGLRVVSVE